MNSLPSDEEVGYEDVNVSDIAYEYRFKKYKSKLNYKLNTGNIIKDQKLYGVLFITTEIGKEMTLFFTGEEFPTYHFVSTKFFNEVLSEEIIN